MAMARGARSMRNTMKLKRKAKRAAAPKKPTSAMGTTLAARQRAKKMAGKKRQAAGKVEATA